MTKEWVFRSKIWKFGDDINTDYMMPSFTPRGLSWKEMAMYCMRAIRPGWAEQVKLGEILVAGRNFGCGSNRPAANILKILGIGCIVADSINSLMLRNCINFVMPALPCQGVSDIFNEGETAEVNISAGSIKNISTGKVLKTTPLPGFLLDIMEEGGLISILEKQGYILKVKTDETHVNSPSPHII